MVTIHNYIVDNELFVTISTYSTPASRYLLVLLGDLTQQKSFKNTD